ncbi:MAG: glycoside hydrolase family 3 C-terminal domain-containing protein [Eubacterium sp.]|nr:glycoside hydrolase family 3 C-terminal domain-containing protein [Eubacterium sp.]
MSEATRKYAKDLVEKMTAEEKLSQMLYASPAIERLHIPAYNWWNEALHGVARAGVATVFPQAIGMAAAFDPAFLYQVADAISTEGRAKFQEFSKRGDRGIYKGLTFWAPNINIFRDPRWGRGHETFGEDPYLTAELGIAFIRGLQGDDPDHLKSAACAKHFAVHSGPEALRHEFDAQVSDHDLYDTYLYAFSRCVKDAKVEAVMGAYNRVNGEPACGSKRLLKDILRKEWQFQGHVVSDCWAVNDFHLNHGVTKTAEESAAMAVNHGCDLNCGNAYLHLGKALEHGLISEEAVTEAVERLMDVRIRLGMMEDYPSPYASIPYDKVECREHTELSVEAARRSLVLLKNKDNLLPLHKDELHTIAVIGPNADSRDALIGNYNGTSSVYITPLEGIRQYVGEETRVLYAQGCHLYKDKVEFLAEEKDRFQEAIAAAEQADVVIACLGLDATIEGEEGDAGNEYASGDKPSLALPGLQQELLEALAATGKPVVLVLLAGSAMGLTWADAHVHALLDAWYPGARGGRAIAEAIFGEFSPSGKLPVTFYADEKELPDFCDYRMENRTYRYTSCSILYPFGYGLSYAEACYSQARVSCTECSVQDTVTLTAEVTNKGSYLIHECVQVYVRHEGRDAYEPGYQLKGIQNIVLEPGETKQAEIVLDRRDFAVITQNGECVAKPGTYTVSIGGSQPDERSEKLRGHKIDTFVIERTGQEETVAY